MVVMIVLPLDQLVWQIAPPVDNVWVVAGSADKELMAEKLLS
jgi:hypothetical protein